MTHGNGAINEKIQADFAIVYIRQDMYEVLNIIDVGTRYGERDISSDWQGNTMMQMIEIECIYHHGAPRFFSADPELFRPLLDYFMKMHHIKTNPRTSRSSPKNGKIERKNCVFKTILSSLSRENKTASPATLVARASFMTNIFHGNAKLSAFQMARGYAPSVLRVPTTDVSQSVLAAHTESVAVRAIKKALRANICEVEPQSCFHKGMRVWVFYKTS